MNLDNNVSEPTILESTVGLVTTSGDIDFRAIGAHLFKHKAFILVVALATGLSALGISFLLPKTYQAQATILPSSTDDMAGAVATSMAAQLGPMAGMLGGLAGSRSADLVEILSSRSMAERVITKVHLDKRLTGWKTHSELVGMVMKQTTITAPSLKSKVISVTFQAPSAETAALGANTYVGELKGMLDEIGYNSAARSRRFVEQQLAKTKSELTRAEDSLAEFQARNNIASLPDTVIASIQSISNLESQRIAAEVQLQSTNDALGTLQSRVKSLQADPNSLADLQLKRNELVAQKAALAKAQEGFQSKLLNLPPKAIALARLQRDVQVQNAVYLALSQQLQTAMINESKESDAFLPLDVAVEPDYAEKPKKKVNTAIGLVTGLLLACVWVLSRGQSAWRKA